MISMENKIDQIKRDLEGRDYKDTLAGLNDALKETREGLVGAVSRNAPQMGLFLFVIVAVQVGLAVAYVLYKRRRANSPKKLL